MSRMWSQSNPAFSLGSRSTRLEQVLLQSDKCRPTRSNKLVSVSRSDSKALDFDIRSCSMDAIASIYCRKSRTSSLEEFVPFVRSRFDTCPIECDSLGIVAKEILQVVGDVGLKSWFDLDVEVHTMSALG
jgi:hypothetical protein